MAVWGFAASYMRQAADYRKLAAANAALQTEYDSLLSASEEREQQLASLSDIASQILIAYGLQRPRENAQTPAEEEWVPAYYSAVGRYGRLQDVLLASRSGHPMSDGLANSTPSIWPVLGHITSSYGTRQDPFTGHGSFHRGVDLSAPYGSPVVATADGYVVSAQWEGALGHCVTIAHGSSGYTTVYGHLKEYFVWRNLSVRRGEIIGLVGSSGRTTGKHVHYEVHHRGLIVNPYRYLQPRPTDYDTILSD